MRLVRLEQGTPAWRLWRHDGLGGSDLAAVLGVSPYEDATREALLRQKVTGRERETNFAMRRGTRLEPVARELYAIGAGCVADPACVEHDDEPWMRVSLDGLCYPPVVTIGRHPELWVLELKCPKWADHDYALEGLVPPHFVPQCQWQLLVTGLDRLDFASFNDGQRYREADHLAVVTVGPDAELQADLLEAGGAFWREVLAARAAAAGGRVPAASGVS